MNLIVTTPEQLETILIKALKSYHADFNSKEPQKPDRCLIEEALIITQISKSKLYKYASSGKIPCMRYNKRLIFSRSQLTDWVECQMKDDNNFTKPLLALASSANNPKRK